MMLWMKTFETLVKLFDTIKESDLEMVRKIELLRKVTTI